MATRVRLLYLDIHILLGSPMGELSPTFPQAASHKPCRNTERGSSAGSSYNNSDRDCCCPSRFRSGCGGSKRSNHATNGDDETAHCCGEPLIAQAVVDAIKETLAWLTPPAPQQEAYRRAGQRCPWRSLLRRVGCCEFPGRITAYPLGRRVCFPLQTCLGLR